MRTVNTQEINHFAKDSAQWWDEGGPFQPLHALNPVRLSYIKDQICTHFERKMDDLGAYRGLSILDIGCGGGLVCEPLSRLGGTVTGVDADAGAIKAAQDHAAMMGLSIDYRVAASEDLVHEKPRFDIVLALEVMEHVDQVDLFVRHCAALCKPGGLMIFSTLNRTARSFLLGKVAAEYILGWVPRGTHDWKKFIRPSELARLVRDHGATPINTTGMVFNPLSRGFALSPDVSVNYFLTARG